MYVVVLKCARDLKQGLAEVNSLAVFIKEPELEVLQGWRNSRGIYLFKLRHKWNSNCKDTLFSPNAAG